MEIFSFIVILLTIISSMFYKVALDDSTTWKYAKYCDPDPTYELNETKVEQMFKDMHPDLSKLYWEEAETITPSKLEKICNNVLVDIMPLDRDLKARYHYAPLNPATLESTRIIRKAAVLFQNEKEFIVHMTVLKCVWVEMDVYLAQGDNKHVFRLDRNPDNTFEFRTGLHPVNYNVL